MNISKHYNIIIVFLQLSQNSFSLDKTLYNTMIFFFQQLFFSYAWSAKTLSLQPKTSGIVVEMPFDGKIYFNNRYFLVEDNGAFPDIQKGDGVFSAFIRTQNTSTEEISLYDNEEGVVHVEIPAISSTEWYFLVLDKEKKHKLYKKDLQVNDNQSFSLQSDERSIVLYLLLLGIFIGLQIRKLPSHRYLSTVFISKKSIPSTIIFVTSSDCILDKIRSLIQHSFVVVIGGSFEKSFQKEVFGTCFFTKSTDIVEIKESISNHHILSNPIYIYTSITTLIGSEEIQVNEILEQLLHEHPENIIVFVEKEEISRYGISSVPKEIESQ